MFKDLQIMRYNPYIFPLTFLIATLIYLAGGVYIRFQMALNDFWGILYYAKHLSLTQPASLYNGFFPIGYAFFLSLIPYRYVTYFAFALNILLAGLFVSCLCVFFYTMKRSVWGVIAVFLATVFYPLIFHYADAVSPDIGTAAFSLGGIYLLWKDEFRNEPTNHRKRDDILAGFLFGLSTLFRYHGIISSTAILFSFTAVMGIRRLWERKAIPITLLLTFLIQVGANLISGHGPLDTGENFTAYITFYGMNWWRIPADAYTFSTVAQFIKDPAGFIRLFIPLFLNLIVYGIPSLLCVLFLRDVREKKYAWFVLLATLLYSMAVAIGTSATSRGPFPVLGMTISCGGLLVMELASRGRSLVRSSKPVSIAVILSMVMAVLWSFGSWLQTDWRFLTVYRAQNQAFRQVEKKLISLGMTTPTEAFTNKLGLYFPGTPPFRPYSNGGWENYSTWGYREEYPEMPINSWEDFVEACSAQRIKFLVLSPGAGLVSDYLGSLYNGQFHPEEVQLIAKIGKTKIFELKNN